MGKSRWRVGLIHSELGLAGAWVAFGPYCLQVCWRSSLWSIYRDRGSQNWAWRFVCGPVAFGREIAVERPREGE